MSNESQFAKDTLGILEGYKEAEPYTPGEEEREKVSAITRKWDGAYRNRLSYERQWAINDSYLRGQQLILRNRATGDLFQLTQNNDSHRLISIFNVLRPTARALLGKLTRAMPTWTVVPGSDDLSDIQGSSIAEDLLHYTSRRVQLDKLYIDLYRNVIKVGAGFLKISWDPLAGQKLPTCPECGFRERKNNTEGAEKENCPECYARAELQYSQEAEEFSQLNLGMLGEKEPEFPEVPTLEDEPEGDLSLELVSHWDLFTDELATDVKEIQWWCHRKAVPINVARKLSPDKAKYISADSRIYSDRRNAYTYNSGLSSNRSAYHALEDHVYIYEFHEAPTSDWPKGRVLLKVNNMIIEEKEDPLYFLGRPSIFAFYFERNEGDFWGESFIDQAFSIQRELNIHRTQMREHRELTNRPKLLTSVASMVSVDEIDTTPGQKIVFNNMGGEPKYMQIPPFAQYVYMEDQRMINDIRMLASITPHEAGEIGGESGRFAAILEAQADQQVGPILKYNIVEFKSLGLAILQTLQEYYEGDRTWTIRGQDRPKTWAFHQMNLSPGYDVDVQEEDAMSQNKALRKQEALNMWSAGIFNDPNTGIPDVKTFARKAGIKLDHVGPPTAASDHATAAAIPLGIENGSVYQPKPWDDPAIFAEELMAWLKGPGQHASSELVEQVGELWKYYVQRTQEAMQAAQGTPGAGPPAEKPGGGGAPTASTVDQAKGGSPSVPQQAQQRVQQADQAAEAAARRAPKHEG